MTAADKRVATTTAQDRDDAPAHDAASGLSQLQRRILRLALTVNMHTQGGVARVKPGSAVNGYAVAAIDYAGSKDLRPPLALWVLGAAMIDKHSQGFFTHNDATRSAKASITRATTRLLERGPLLYAPLPDQPWGRQSNLPSPGYVLSAQGLIAAGTAPLNVPCLVEACELFGITHRAEYDSCRSFMWMHNERLVRKDKLMEVLEREHRERLPTSHAGMPITIEHRLPASASSTSVTDAPWREINCRTEAAS